MPTRESSCLGKVAITDPSIARRAAKRKKGRMPYKCRYCGLWHVGSQKFAAKEAR